MLNDKLGQISLNRVKRKKRQQKKRKTQSLLNFKNANSYSMDALKRNTLNIFTISSDESFISYEGTNPKNEIKRNSGFSFGNFEIDKYSFFDESNIGLEQRKQNLEKDESFFLTSVYTTHERKNARYDIFKRCTDITNITKNYPFSQENTNSLKCTIGEGLQGKDSYSQIITNKYEDFDVKASFIDNQSLEIKSGFYISSKNYYNNGKIKSFSEKDSIKNNSIIATKNEDNEYNNDHRYFKTSGFVYESKRPDSIAFGGLKR